MFPYPVHFSNRGENVSIMREGMPQDIVDTQDIIESTCESVSHTIQEGHDASCDGCKSKKCVVNYCKI